MSQNTQVPYLFTLDGSAGDYLEIIGARSITCYSSGGATDIENSSGQNMALPNGVSIQIDADTGNTLTLVTITPQASATSYVSMLGGNATQY